MNICLECGATERQQAQESCKRITCYKGRKDYNKSIMKTGLKDQIEFAELMVTMYNSPLTIAILNSLIELKGIKEKNGSN